MKYYQKRLKILPFFIFQKIVQLLDMIETWTLLKAFYLIMNKGIKEYTNRIENIYVASASEIVRKQNANITQQFDYK